MSIQGTLTERRRLVIEALSRELSDDPGSAASRLGQMLNSPRPMVVSADVDGLVSAAMLRSVAPDWEIVAFVRDSALITMHPTVAAAMPADLVAVDLFSPAHDSLSNHVVKWGRKRSTALPGLMTAFNAWDVHVDAQSAHHLFALPTLWTGTEACNEAYTRPWSSKYRYPFGTAQFLLAMLESSGNAPKFFDRHYLPWLVASCDGGVTSYTKHAYNARVWWPTMAGAVGPSSLSEQIYRLVDGMRPHEFLDVVNALDRERAATVVRARRGTPARALPAWLNDRWNLVNSSVDTIERCLSWLRDLSGWPDPVRGGITSLQAWQTVPVGGSGIAAVKGVDATTPATEPASVAVVAGAPAALNANFYLGSNPGSRFNWVGGW